MINMIKEKIMKTNQPKKKMTDKRKKELIFLICMLTIPVVHFFVFWLYVNVDSILLAFKNRVGEFNNFDNFKWFYNNLTSDTPYVNMKEAIKNTFIFWTWNTLVEIPLALAISYFIFKKIRGGHFFRVVLYMPAIVSAVIMTSAFKNVIRVDGPADYILQKVFNKEIPRLLYDSKYAMKTLIGYGLYTGFGVNIILFSGAMARIPQEVFESAKLDGITPFKEITKIILPLIWPLFSTIIILSVAGLFSASGPILLFTKGEYGTMTIAYAIFQQYFEYQQIERAAAIGLIFTALSIPLIIFTRWLLNKGGDVVEY